MGRTATLKNPDGTSQKLTLPKLSEDNLLRLGQALHTVREACSITSLTNKPLIDLFKAGSKLWASSCTLCHGKDTRKKIVNLPEFTLSKLVNLACQLESTGELNYAAYEEEFSLVFSGFGITEEVKKKLLSS